MDPSVNVFDLHKKRSTEKIHCGACDTLRRLGLNKLRIILIIVFKNNNSHKYYDLYLANYSRYLKRFYRVILGNVKSIYTRFGVR